MKILLDECVPWPMHKLFAAHDCTTAKKRGWGGIQNGELLRLAQGKFDLFITADQNIRYQQNLAGRRIAILELTSNDPAKSWPQPQTSSPRSPQSSGVSIAVSTSGFDCRLAASRLSWTCATQR
jgi:hypothetical protein